MADLMKLLHERARSAKTTILLPDGEDPRIGEAAAIILAEGLATPLVMGKGHFETMTSQEQADLIQAVLEARDARGKPIAAEEARQWLASDTKYVAAAMVRLGMADGYVAGNLSTTADTLRPALQIIGAEGYASSYFIMLYPDGRPVFFADCGFNQEPDAEELAHIAADTARQAQTLGIEPRVAFLSSSTAGSAAGARVEKARHAIAAAKRIAPELEASIGEQEMQWDAATDPAVASRKMPNSQIAGRANVFIFPDLDSGNIAYKIARDLGKMAAIGPIMQGLNAPANDLSRGCSVQDIVDVVAVTAMQAGARKKSSMKD